MGYLHHRVFKRWTGRFIRQGFARPTVVVVVVIVVVCTSTGFSPTGGSIPGMIMIAPTVAAAVAQSSDMLSIYQTKHHFRVDHIHSLLLHVVEELFANVVIVLHPRTTVPEDVQFLTAQKEIMTEKQNQ